MSIWSRLANLFRTERLHREIEEELRAHLEEGRDPEEVRKTFGSLLRHREQSRDVRLVVWIDSIRADLIFG